MLSRLLEASILCWGRLTVSPALHTELWTSWASLLRSYAASHGLNSTQHAVVEVSADQITLRVGSHWLRFTETEMQQSGAAPLPFALTEDGSMKINGGAAEEMDFVAERLAREMMQIGSNPNAEQH